MDFDKEDEVPSPYTWGFEYLQTKADSLMIVRISETEFHPPEFQKVPLPLEALPSSIIEYAQHTLVNWHAVMINGDHI